MLSAGIYRSVSVCPSREIALAGDWLEKQGSRLFLQNWEFGSPDLLPSTLMGTSFKDLAHTSDWNKLGLASEHSSMMADYTGEEGGICRRKSPNCTPESPRPEPHASCEAWKTLQQDGSAWAPGPNLFHPTGHPVLFGKSEKNVLLRNSLFKSLISSESQGLLLLFSVLNASCDIR